MSRIADLIAEHCANGVDFVRLGDLLDYQQPSKFLVKSVEYDDSFSTPVLTAGQTFILGYTNEVEGVYPASTDSPVVIFDDFTTAFKWVEFPFKAKSSAMKILTPYPGVDLRYIWFAMQTIPYAPKDHARQWIGTYSQFRIPYPPIEIQHEIVRILDTFSKMEAELEAELEARKQQYEHYRDAAIQNSESRSDWLTLYEVAEYFGRGKSKHRPRNDPSLYGGPYPFIQTGDIRNSNHRIIRHSQTYSEKGLKQSQLWPVGTICITIAANIAETGILQFDACFPDSIIGMIVDPKVAVPGYVEYLLRSRKESLVSKGQGSAQANINLATFREVRFPFPSIEEQNHIVDLLDNFDALVNDLCIGLPAELAARRQQYEYYRNKLLTFTEAN